MDCYGAGETVLADMEPSATALALDETRVYWASPGSDCSTGRIRSVAKAGGAVTTLASNETNPRAVAVDDLQVHFYDGCGSGKLRSVDKNGGPVLDRLVDVDLVNDARVLAEDAENIYFNDYGLLSIPKAGGAHHVVDATTFVTALAADDAGVFWAGPLNGKGDYAVSAHHPGDPSPSVLTTASDTGSGIALDASFVYFTSDAGIRRVSRKGGPLGFVTAAKAWKLAVDDTHVYWTEGVLGSSCSVKKAPKTGGGETTEIASCTGAYLDIAVDEVCVYWANLYGNNVMRAPK